MNSSCPRFIILIIWVLTNSTIFVFSFSNNVTDHQALLSVKASIKIDPLGVLSSWNDSVHFCQWNGVICSHRRQRVTELDLSWKQLVGTLSSHIGNLTFLRAIHLYQNCFHGSIPNEISRLSRLQYLQLGHNKFQGEFPSNLSHCVNIRNITMDDNHLEGKLPTEFASWSKLNIFNLGMNQFTGSIPPSLGNLSHLHVIDLRSNNLTGGIPLEIAHLAKLEIIILSANKLSGMVPLPLYNISSLSDIRLDGNELEGKLPTDLGFTLPNLQKLYLGRNKFSGPLPPSITNVSNLVTFDISYNIITDPIPMNLGSLQNIQVPSLSGNPLRNNQLSSDLGFFDSLVNCTHLKILALDDIGLRGELPTSLANLSITIETLDMAGNHIHGNIPYEIGKLVNMTRLALSNNFLTGSIPESIGELSKLGRIYLGDNNISGVIPTSIGNITQLSVLSLPNNMLQGSIPNGLCNISTLLEVFLTNNGLGGVIPEQIIGFSSQCFVLNLDKNLFTGQLPSNIGSFKQLVQLDVSNNQLTGYIPNTLGDCVMLEALLMEGNQFEGRIPSSFKALKSLVILDLSSNNISENIPRFFDNFKLIEFLNLSHNKLGGEVPKEGLFSNASHFSVAGNLRLCGGIQALQLPPCPVNFSRTMKKTSHLRIILLLVVIPLAIMLACLTVLFLRQRKSKQKNVTVSELQDSQYPKLSYQKLLLATNEFSPNNLLGEGRYGSVYKGNFESLEQTFAVKVLNAEVRGANRSFLAECETLRNIRHRNLIKIITACSSTDFKGNDFKALVYEFMTNGSLDNWLHPCSGNERNLSLLQRLNISIDIGMGLNYLHHHSHTSIIHCDIKPSNILLDEDFVARVGDFGLARFSMTASDINQVQTSSTGVRGTVGYVPPEYGMGGEISAEGDVYSYGILLLEMFSGKRPTGSSKVMENCSNLYDYVHKALPRRVLDIVDPRIMLDQEDRGLIENQSYSKDTMEACLASIFEMGILCSDETPSKRIDISVAIKQLHVARDKILQRRHKPG